MKTVSIVLAALASLVAAAAPAQTIFRCGHEYTSVACADARTVVVAADVTREERAEARQVALREKALAAEMARDRRANEAALKPALAGSLSAPPRAAEPAPARATSKRPKKHRRGSKVDDDRDFIATVPKTRKAKG